MIGEIVCDSNLGIPLPRCGCYALIMQIIHTIAMHSQFPTCDEDELVLSNDAQR